jgi:hypothetical protein
MGWHRKPEREAINETEKGHNTWLSPQYPRFAVPGSLKVTASDPSQNRPGDTQMATERHTCDSKDMGRRLLLSAARAWFGAMGLLCPVILASCLGCHRRVPEPPDIATCTRWEVQFIGGALNYFFSDSFWQETILNEEERVLVRSYDTWMVTDREQVQAFARRVSQIGLHNDRGVWNATVTGYRGRRRLVSFITHGPDMPTVRNMDFLHPPELKPLLLRWKCVENLSILHGVFWRGPGRHVYPDPNRWCDMIVAHYREGYTTYDLEHRIDPAARQAAIAALFICPSIQPSFLADDAHSQAQQTDPPSQTPTTWICTYAMNPNCREDSPPDTVSLFESKPGWNQHGGPELFTFDNHDPKGGLVLLKDGTMKFIRTEEELKQLRWK